MHYLAEVAVNPYPLANVVRAITICLWGIFIMGGLGAVWTSLKARRALASEGNADPRFSDAQQLGLTLVVLGLLYAFATEIAFRIAFVGVGEHPTLFTWLNLPLFLVCDGLFYWSIRHDRLQMEHKIDVNVQLKSEYTVTVRPEGQFWKAEVEGFPEAAVLVRNPAAIAGRVKYLLSGIVGMREKQINLVFVDDKGHARMREESG